MFRYRLFRADGSEAAGYAVNIAPGEEILVGNGRRLRVLDVVPVGEEGSPYVGLLKGRGGLGGRELELLELCVDFFARLSVHEVNDRRLDAHGGDAADDEDAVSKPHTIAEMDLIHLPQYHLSRG